MPEPITINFGSWTPDLSTFGNPGTGHAKNCLPSRNGYRQMLGQNVFSDALLNRCQGATTVIKSDGTVHSYAGDATKLYHLSAATWSDVSATTYSIADDVFWEFAQFGEKIIATNISDAVQVATIGSGNFSNMITSTLKPQARHICVTDDFVVLGNTSEGGTVFPRRVRWSGINDETDFDQSATTQSDSQDVEGEGWVQALVGFGRDFYVFQERGITVARYEGTPAIFRFDLAEKNRGTIAPGSVVALGRNVFYLADDGFYMFDGAQSHPIGKEKVDAYFYDNADPQYLSRMSAAIDPARALVIWAFVTTGSVPNMLLIYSWATEQWTFAEVTNEFIFRDLTKGYTLDQLDDVSSTLSGLPFSLDSRVWAGGLIQLSGFNTSHRLVNYNGAALTAEIDTKEMQLFPGYLGFAETVRPLVEGSSATVTVQAGTRATLRATESFGSATSVNSIGEADLRSVGRYHTFRCNISGGFDHALGVQVYGKQWGRQ